MRFGGVGSLSQATATVNTPGFGLPAFPGFRQAARGLRGSNWKTLNGQGYTCARELERIAVLLSLGTPSGPLS